MPRNGSGNFSLTPGNPVISGTDISSSVHNATMADIASEISNSLAKDGQTVPTGNLPMGGFKHTGVSGGSSRNEYPSIGQIQDNSATWAGTAGGSANAVLLIVSPAIPAYVAGQSFAYKALSTNTGALVISIGGLPNRDVQINGLPLFAGDHVAGQWYRVTYDGAAFQLEQISSKPLLRDTVSVKDFGAKGDGTTNDTAAIQGVINKVAADGGGTVWFPAGTYRVANLWARNNVLLRGTFGAVILKLLDGVDKQVLGNEGQSAGTSISCFGLEGLILDGNKTAVAGVVASSACAVNIVDKFYARDCIFRNATGYGLGFQAYPGSSIVGAQKNIYLENCYLLDNGDGVGGDTYDGIDIKDCDELTMIGCSAVGNSDKGINIRGEKVFLSGCYAAANAGSGFEFAGNNNGQNIATTLALVGCEARGNGGAGFAVADGSATPVAVVRASLSGISASGNLYGVQVPSQGTNVQLIVSDANIFSNTSHGVIVRATPQAGIFRGCVIRSNGGSGISTSGGKLQVDSCQINLNARYGIEEAGGATRNTVAGASQVQGNTLGAFLWNPNGRRHVGRAVVDYDSGVGDVIASAATITLPEGGDVFAITGSANISSITVSRRGRVVTLQFTGALTVNDNAGNIAIGSNFTAASTDTLTLMCDGTNWLGVSRSDN